MRLLTIYVLCLLLFGSCHPANTIDAAETENIELIQVEHPYLGGRIGSVKLDNKLVTAFNGFRRQTGRRL